MVGRGSGDCRQKNTLFVKPDGFRCEISSIINHTPTLSGKRHFWCQKHHFSHLRNVTDGNNKVPAERNSEDKDFLHVAQSSAFQNSSIYVTKKNLEYPQIP